MDFCHEMGCLAPDLDDNPALKSPTFRACVGKGWAIGAAQNPPKIAKNLDSPKPPFTKPPFEVSRMTMAAAAAVKIL